MIGIVIEIEIGMSSVKSLALVGQGGALEIEIRTPNIEMNSVRSIAIIRIEEETVQETPHRDTLTSRRQRLISQKI